MKPPTDRLPARRPAARPEPPAAGAAGPAGPGGDTTGTQDDAPPPQLAEGPLRVLVVEDLPRVQELLHELIHEPGRLEVVGLAETERDAIALYEQLRPQAVVVDLNLRSGTGLGVIAGVRGLPGPLRPLLIVLTNHALPVLQAACLKAGADHFLDKSRDFHQVRVLLEQAWSGQPPRPVSPMPPGGGAVH